MPFDSLAATAKSVLKPVLKPTPRTEDGGFVFFEGGLIAHDIFPPEHGGSYTSKQRFSATNKWTKMGRASPATPPIHYHLSQAECFEVKEGVLSYEVDGKLGTMSAGESRWVKPYVSHTFWNDPATGDEDLVVHITVKGTALHSDTSGFDDRFMANFYGYLSQTVLAGKAPNPLQMLRFLDDADVILADLPRPLGRLLNILVGRWIGGWLAGYQARYKVFESKSI